MSDGPIRRRRLHPRRLRWTRGWLLLVLVSLLAMFVLYAVFREHTGVLGVALVTVLLGSFRALDRSHGAQAVALALAVLHVGLIIAHDPAVDPPSLRVAGQLFGVLFYGFMAYVIFLHVVRSRVVVADTLYGAASVYLLLSLVWALGYAVLYTYEPHAFMGPAAGALAWHDFIYFSIATLTTLGYGDIYPVTPGARSLAMLEVVVGVFYTTVVLARLVGMYIAQGRGADLTPPVPPAESAP